ncbi:SMI1/KNR4 family protein [Streptomyces atratus]|uniref:SMI1/KNR4 family protein n=1 Tax=Streptomyces atratus TaxID=1893 RepID=UPI00340A36F2
MDIDNWKFFLERWSRQWLAAQTLLDPEKVDEEAFAAGTLGFPAAGEQDAAALEHRLGTALPPSYRAFLRVSNGWRNAGRSVHLLGIAERVHWHGDPPHREGARRGSSGCPSQAGHGLDGATTVR